MCGRSVAFGKSRSRGLTAGSSGYTSSPTAPSFQSCESHKQKGLDKLENTYVSVFQCFDQCCLVDDLPSSCVYNDSAFLELPDHCLIDKTLGIRSYRDMDTQHVRES